MSNIYDICMQQNCECFVNNAKQISIRCVEQMSQNQGCHIVTFVWMLKLPNIMSK